MNTRTLKASIGLAVALAAVTIGPATAQAAAPTCNDMNVGVPHNAATPIFINCTGAVAPHVLITEDPGHGTLSVALGEESTDRWVTYTPDPGHAGADSFKFRGVNPSTDEASAEKTVSLQVAPGTAPVCANLSQSVPKGLATKLRLVCAFGGDPIVGFTKTNPTSGTLTAPDLTGLATYTSGAAAGAASFTYRAESDCGAEDCVSAPATFDLTVLDPQQGPPGANGSNGAPGPTGPAGPAGQQGPQGALGPTGPVGSTGAAGPSGLNGANGRDGAPGRVATTPRLMVASFLDALTARSGKAVVLRYVSTTDARVILEVFKGKRRVASVAGRAHEGRNAIRWDGKAGSKAATSGLYRLVLRAASGGQVASDAATVRVSGRAGRPSTGGGGGGGGGGGVPGGIPGGGVGEG